MGSFAYVVPASVEADCVIIYINLVILMRWVDSPKFFCAISETLTHVANLLVHKSLPVPAYRAIAVIPDTGLGPPYTLGSLTYINCYIYGVITVVQGGAYRGCEVFNGTLWSLK